MNFRPRWLRYNLRIKAGLLALATLLWFLVVTERIYDYTMPVPIVLSGIQDDHVLVDPIPVEAAVKFHATGRELLQMLYVSSPILRLDLENDTHDTKIKLNHEMVVIPGGLSGTATEVLHPTEVKIKLDRKVTKAVNIKPDVVTMMAAGYTVDGPYQINPPAVKITGPSVNVDLIESLVTDKIELKNLKRNTKTTVNILNPQKFGLEIHPPQVDILVKVQRIGERKIVGVPVAVLNEPFAKSVILEPTTVDVKVAGGISILSDLTPDDIDAWVDFMDHSAQRSGRIPVKLDPPSHIEILECIPSEIKLIVRHP